MMITTDEEEERRSKKPKLDPVVVADENPESLEGDDEDRLSALPEEILHQILSYLYMTEVIQTSLLSTTWRNLWKSHPFLLLRSRNFISKSSSTIMDFIDHVFLLRDHHHSSKLLQFRLHSRVSIIEVDRFLDSIVTAVNQGVEVISTTHRRLSYSRATGITSNTTTTTLNPCIFDSGVVRVFKFAVTDSLFRIQIPRSMCSSTHLRIVYLNGIKLPEGDSKNELHLICPLLENLTITNCFHKHLSVLSISTPKLKTLCIYNDLNQSFLCLHGKCILEIRTPKLKSFKYNGNSYVDYTFKDKLLFLTRANVQLYPVNKWKQESQDIIFLRSIKILERISKAKWLSIRRFEDFSWVPNTLRKVVLLNPFTRLRYLRLESIPSLSSVHGMTYLLLTTCNVLETFVWKVQLQGGSVKEDEGEEHEDVMLSKGSFSHLKLVKTMNLRGHKNELIFLRFLLKRAVVLEELTITTANPNKKIADEEQEYLKQMKFMEELEALRNFSPSTKLTFKINDVERGPATFHDPLPGTEKPSEKRHEEVS